MAAKPVTPNKPKSTRRRIVTITSLGLVGLIAGLLSVQ